MIEFKNVSKKYETGTEAVKNASFKIEKGEFAFLVGSSGSGKSTLIKLILKEEEPTSGNIIINGKDTTFLKRNRVPYLRRSMGVVFQDFRLLPDKTVYENVAFAMYIVKATPRHIRRQVPMVLSLVGLSGKAKMYPNELSGGEQQRVALARALVNNPSMIIADEPTGNLDPDTAWDIMNLLNEINMRGTTVVVATHAKDIVDQMRKRVRFNVMSYLIGEGFRNVFKNKKSTMSSLMIMCATMLVFGLFFVIGENINQFVKEVADAQGIRVFVKTDATESEVEEVGREILGVEGVRTAEYISKEEGLESMRETLGDDIVAGYTDRVDILPAAYEVTLTDLELNEQVQENILQIPNVDSIESSNKVISQVIRLAKGVRVITGAILILLVIISIAIISNTIKLTVHARRREISIMKYVGATNSFIRWPFLVEGVLIGVAAGILSVAIIGVAYTYIAGKLSGAIFLEMANWRLIEFKDMFNLILTVYLALGIGIGMVGSGISMRKYLDV